MVAAKAQGTGRHAVETLGRAIVSASPYRPDEVISLNAVMQRVGVSRAMAREVLQVLHQKRLVALRARVGATVRPLQDWDLFDPDVIAWRLESTPRAQMRSLTALREAVEPRAAHLAAQQASAEVCRDLISLGQELKELGMDRTFERDDAEGERHRERYSDVDALFHTTVLRGSGNEMFLALSDPMTKALRHRLERDWVGAVRHPAGTSPERGEPTRFPLRPAEISLWLHCGLGHAVNQGHPVAAEAFACAILAEIRGGLDNPVLRFALREEALALLDPKGFADEHEWSAFESAIMAIAREPSR